MKSKKPLKAVFIVPNLSPGGIQTQVFLLARLMKENEIEPAIFGLYSKNDAYVNQLRDSGIQCTFLPHLGDGIRKYYGLGVFRKVALWFQLWRFLRNQKRCVVFPFTPRIDMFFNVLKPFSRVVLSFSFERGGHIKPTPQAENWITRRKRRSKPTYVANSMHGREALSIIQNVPKEEIFVIRNAYDPSFIERNGSNSDIRKSLNLNGSIVVMVANFFDEKDHLTVIRAWSKSQFSRDSTLVFVGLGASEQCKANYQRARELVEELGLTSVRFLGEFGEVHRILRVADVGLLSSITEGCPNAVLEYMLMKLPVTGTRIPGIEEVISEENKNYLFDVGDVSQAEQAINKLLGDATLRHRLGEINFQHVQREFSQEKMTEGYMKILIDQGVL